MAQFTKSRLSAQAKPSRFHAQYVDEREVLRDGTTRIRLGLNENIKLCITPSASKSFIDPKASRPIEVIDALQLTVLDACAVHWSHRPIVKADAKIIEREFESVHQSRWSALQDLSTCS